MQLRPEQIAASMACHVPFKLELIQHKQDKYREIQVYLQLYLSKHLLAIFNHFQSAKTATYGSS